MINSRTETSTQKYSIYTPHKLAPHTDAPYAKINNIFQPLTLISAFIQNNKIKWHSPLQRLHRPSHTLPASLSLF